MCKCFHNYFQQRDTTLHTRGFSLAYSSCIPRQSGLSGSSAIACAALNCLLEHYGVQQLVPVSDRPGLVLGAEQELGIAAGWMDRVIQVGQHALPPCTTAPPAQQRSRSGASWQPAFA